MITFHEKHILKHTLAFKEVILPSPTYLTLQVENMTTFSLSCPINDNFP